MSQRYFVEPRITAEQVRLVGAEAHHLLHVMRCRQGDSVELFDGSGNDFQAEVSTLGRDWVELNVKSSAAVDRELKGKLIVAAALPKGDRQRVLVEKLVELGVSELVPLVTARGVAQSSDHAIARLERYAIEASKQCGRNRLMKIGDSKTCATYFSDKFSTTRLIALQGGSSLAEVTWSSSVAIAIGPEGGFTDDEIASAVAHHWQTVHLGPRTLRVETAAIFLSAIASVRLGGEY